MTLKAELHTHTADDPVDRIPYSAIALIDRAAELGFTVLAITLHDRQFDIRSVASHARDRGIVLIPGVERTIRGKHVLLLNFPPAAEAVTNLDDVRRLKARSRGLVIAPHPFFPYPTCLGGELDSYADLFDAVEVNAFYTRWIDFNRKAVAWADRHDVAMVGNGDVHRLAQLGTTFSMIEGAEADPESICTAIREGRVRVERQPITMARATRILSSMAVSDFVGRAVRVRDLVAPSAASVPAGK